MFHSIKIAGADEQLKAWKVALTLAVVEKMTNLSAAIGEYAELSGLDAQDILDPDLTILEPTSRYQLGLVYKVFDTRAALTPQEMSSSYSLNPELIDHVLSGMDLGKSRMANLGLIYRAMDKLMGDGYHWTDIVVEQAHHLFPGEAQHTTEVRRVDRLTITGYLHLRKRDIAAEWQPPYSNGYKVPVIVRFGPTV